MVSLRQFYGLLNTLDYKEHGVYQAEYHWLVNMNLTFALFAAWLQAYQYYIFNGKDHKLFLPVTVDICSNCDLQLIPYIDISVCFAYPIANKYGRYLCIKNKSVDT